MSRAACALLLVPALLCLACGDGARRYEARGVVREVRPEWKQVVIAHEDIEGLMPAMTMNFDVEDPALLARLERGQAIAFSVEADAQGYRVVEARVLGEGEGGAGPSLGALLPPREPAPEFELSNQFGDTVSLASLRGRVLVIDFIYTRCPGPCPLQTARFVELQRALPEALRDTTHFVSISLDPGYDTPERLRAYAEQRGADLAHWDFLTGPPQQVGDVVRRFGIGSLRRPDGEIDHLVATFLVDREGRIAERFVGLDHDTDELLGELERLASSKEAGDGPPTRSGLSDSVQRAGKATSGRLPIHRLAQPSGGPEAPARARSEREARPG
jgi:protein SCO1/2